MLTHKEYCGHWFLDDLSRTLEFKRMQLRRVDKERDDIVSDIDMIKAEIQTREVQ